MSPFRSRALTVAVAVAGAAWGMATYAVTDSIRYGFAGQRLSMPIDLVLGPLVLIDRLLPEGGPLFPLMSAWYGAAAVLLWHGRDSRSVAIAALVLCSLLLAGPPLGVGTASWSRLTSMSFGWTYHAAREMPLRFTGMILGVVGWHAFAWFRLTRIQQPDWVPLLSAAFAGTAFGGTLWWLAEVLASNSAGIDLPLLLAVGPIPWFQRLARTPTEWHFAAPALTYGLLGYFLAASRVSAPAARFTTLAFAAFVAGTLIAIGVAEATSPGFLLRELQAAGRVSKAAPTLFAMELIAIAGWNAMAVWILCKAHTEERT